MAAFDDIAYGLLQVVNPRNLNFDARGQEIVDTIRTLSKEEADEVLSRLERQTNFTPEQMAEIRRIVSAIQALTEETAESAGRLRLVPADLIAEGGQGLRVPFLQSQYSAWTKTTDSVDKSVQAWLDYLKAAQPDTKTMRILRILLGVEWDAAARATARTQHSDRWPLLRLIYRALTGSVNTAGELKTLVSGSDQAIEAAVRAQVEDSVRHLGRSLRPTPEMGDDIVDGLSYFAENGDLAGPMSERILDLLKRYSPDGTLAGLREEDLLRLLGNRAHSVEQVFDEIVFGHVLIYRELAAMARRGAGNGMDLELDEIDDLFRMFMQIDGVEQFFELMLRRHGYEHGLLFEQLVAFQFLHWARTNPHLLPEGLDIVECMILQSRIADKCGPDLLVIRRINGHLVATVIQAKSFKQLNNLIRMAISNSGTVTVTGEVLSQARKDIRRLLKEAGVNQTATGASNIGLETYDSLLRSKIDWNRIQKERFDLDLNQVRDFLPPGTSIDGMDLNTVITSRDPAISRAVRDAFYDTHLREVANEVNDQLLRFGDELATEVMTMTVDGFRAAYARPELAGPAQTAFDDLIQALQSTTPNPGARAEAFRRYYDAMFNITDSANGVQIDFKLVDTRIDGDIVDLF